MKLLVLFTLVIFHIVHSYKILVYSGPLSFSHAQFMGWIAHILQDAGHDVTVLHPIRDQKHVFAVSNSTTKQILVELPENLRTKMDPKNLNIWGGSGTILDQLQFMNDFHRMQSEACDTLLGDNRTIEALKNEHFDVGITELIVPCGFAIFDKAGVDHIICASAVGLTDSLREFFDVPGLSSFFPFMQYSENVSYLFNEEVQRELENNSTGEMIMNGLVVHGLAFLTTFTDKMNFVERTINFIASYFTNVVTARMFREYQDIWERHGASGKAEHYLGNVNYMLSNTDEFLDYAYPTTPKIVHIGGITLAEKKELSEEFRNLMEQKDRAGVVYISFGSLVPTSEMPSYFRDAIFHATKMFPQITFIWKMDADDTPPNIPNLHTFTWLPQQSLLGAKKYGVITAFAAHPNLLCFVSHAGLNSVLELTRSGKPSILVPVFADQFRNARVVERKNTTIVLMKEDFNKNSFEAALRQILYDKSYALRARRLASLMVNKPFPIKDRLLSTVEFSTRHGKIENLDIYGRNLNTLQYYSIDVAAFLAVIAILIIFSFFQLAKSCLRRITVKKVKKD